MNLEIPAEIEDRYEGEWIAWDTETSEVVAHNADLDTVVDQVITVRRPGRVIYYHHILPPDVVIVGGL